MADLSDLYKHVESVKKKKEQVRDKKKVKQRKRSVWVPEAKCGKISVELDGVPKGKS